MIAEDILRYFRQNLDESVTGVTFVREWHGAEIYAPVFDDYMAIGQPMFAEVRGNTIKLTSPEESRRILATLEDDE